MAFQLNSKGFDSYTKYPFCELLSFNCKLLYSEQVTGLEPANLLHGKQTRYQLRYTCIYRFYEDPVNLVPCMFTEYGLTGKLFRQFS